MNNYVQISVKEAYESMRKGIPIYRLDHEYERYREISGLDSIQLCFECGDNFFISLEQTITLKAKQIIEQSLAYCVTELVLELAGNASYVNELIDYINNDYIYEYWIVDYQLAAKLKSKKEIVFDFLGMTIWARTSTGQVAYVDDVIQEIAKDIIEDEITV